MRRWRFLEISTDIVEGCVVFFPAHAVDLTVWHQRVCPQAEYRTGWYDGLPSDWLNFGKNWVGEKHEAVNGTWTQIAVDLAAGGWEPVDVSRGRIVLKLCYDDSE